MWKYVWISPKEQEHKSLSVAKTGMCLSHPIFKLFLFITLIYCWWKCEKNSFYVWLAWTLDADKLNSNMLFPQPRFFAVFIVDQSINIPHWFFWVVHIFDICHLKLDIMDYTVFSYLNFLITINLFNFDQFINYYVCKLL